MGRLYSKEGEGIAKGVQPVRRVKYLAEDRRRETLEAK
jgi:hypothetical protein